MGSGEEDEMKYFVLIIVMVGFIPIVSGICEDGQIDINSASLEELDEITWIGLPRAQAIVDTRPFDSVDDLVRVSGIKDGIEKKHESHIRMYSYHELIAIFKHVGFVDIEGYGNLKEEPITLNHRMMFVFGTKPK